MATNNTTYDERMDEILWSINPEQIDSTVEGAKAQLRTLFKEM